MLIVIAKHWNERLVINWAEVNEVRLDKIRSKKDNIMWIYKIVFGKYRIYLGYEKISESDSIPHACYATEKDGQRVGMSLWIGKPHFNDHKSTKKMLDDVAKKIVEDILTETNPIDDVKLEKEFMENGW